MTQREVRDQTMSSPERRLPLPHVIADGGWSGWLASLISGAVFGGVVLLIPALEPDGLRRRRTPGEVAPMAGVHG